MEPGERFAGPKRIRDQTPERPKRKFGEGGDVSNVNCVTCGDPDDPCWLMDDAPSINYVASMETHCEVCGGSDKPNEMLICNSWAKECNKKMHLTCLDVAADIYWGTWHCHECLLQEMGKESVVQEPIEEITQLTADQVTAKAHGGCLDQWTVIGKREKASAARAKPGSKVIKFTVKDSRGLIRKGKHCKNNCRELCEEELKVVEHLKKGIKRKLEEDFGGLSGLA
jgi:hypothetical protein